MIPIRTLLTMFALMLVILTTSAQTKATGTVVDANMEPVIGASVIQAGTTKVTVTDSEISPLFKTKNLSATFVNHLLLCRVHRMRSEY